MNLQDFFENIDREQQRVKQLPADFQPANTSPQLSGPYPGKNATRGYLVGEGQDLGDNPMAQAVTRRIMNQHLEWIQRYGIEAVMQVIDDVTAGEEGWEEIGSSDVSAYVSMVGDRLADSAGSREEMRDRRPFAEQGVAEGTADIQRKVFKKNGKPVGEVGMDLDASPGQGDWYIKHYASDTDLSGYDSYAEAVQELKHLVRQGVAEGTTNMPIGQQMARDGVTYTPEKERELIELMGEYMQRAGMSPKAIRYYLSHDEDWVSDQLEYLPRQGVSEGSDQDDANDFYAGLYAELFSDVYKNHSMTDQVNIKHRIKRALEDGKLELVSLKSEIHQLESKLKKKGVSEGSQQPKNTTNRYIPHPKRVGVKIKNPDYIEPKKTEYIPHAKKPGVMVKKGVAEGSLQELRVDPDDRDDDDGEEQPPGITFYPLQATTDQMTPEDARRVESVARELFNQGFRYREPDPALEREIMEQAVEVMEQLDFTDGTIARLMRYGMREQFKDRLLDRLGGLTELLGTRSAITGSQDLAEIQQQLSQQFAAEDVLGDVRQRLGDMIQAKAERRARQMQRRQPPQEVLGEPVRRIEIAPGQVLEIHGNEDDGFRIYRSGRSMPTRFATLEHAEIATEMFLRLDEAKKDACYHKVKSRYKVWPSAYASGALVQCRKQGADNWGKGNKK
jgi:hypothetical protein